MRRVPVDQIEPGMVLARSIRMPNDHRMILLQANREIPLNLVPRLQKMGIFNVWVKFEQTEFLEDIVSVGLNEHQHDVYANFRDYCEENRDGASGFTRFDKFDDCVSEFADFLKGNRNCHIFLEKLDSFDNYLMSHSSNVCYLSMVLGMRLEGYLIRQRPMKSAGEARDIHFLGLGSLLHDIGKLGMPRSIIDKPGKLTDQEYQEMKRHPIIGYEMLRDKVPTVASQIALNHHQRWDGTGYPSRQDIGLSDDPTAPAGNKIHIFSRITAAADVYDALTTERTYCRAMKPVEALAIIEAEEEGHFDPVVKEALFEVCPAFTLGQDVTLSNGFEAIVCAFDPKNPTRPKVSCMKAPDGSENSDTRLEEIDLADYDDVRIVAVDGHDVRKAINRIERAANKRNAEKQPETFQAVR